MAKRKIMNRVSIKNEYILKNNKLFVQERIYYKYYKV